MTLFSRKKPASCRDKQRRANGAGYNALNDFDEDYRGDDDSCSLLPQDTQKRSQEFTLKRDVGLFSSITLLLGAIIGTGIFITPGNVLRNSKTITIDLLLWTLGGVNALIGGLCAAELGALLPASGGDYAFFLAAGRPYGVCGDLPAFFYAWTCFFLEPAATSIQGLTFSAYLLSLPYPDCSPPYEVNVLVSSLFIRNHIWDTQPYSDTHPSVGDLAAATYSAIYCYSGWNCINCVAEEIKNPGRNIPVAIAVSVIITVITYLLVNLAFFVVLDSQTIASTDAVAVTFARATWGRGMGAVMPLVIALTVFGSTCVDVLASSRIFFAASREGHLARFMSFVHVENSVPLAAVVARCILSLTLTLVGSVHFLIEVSILLGNVWEAVSVVSLLLLRRSMRDAPRPYRVPTVIAVLRLLVCVVLAGVTLVQVRRYAYQYAMLVATFAIGAVYYYLFVRKKIRLRGSQRVSLFLQKCLNSAPCASELEKCVNEIGPVVEWD
ncbi:Y+L amino acid transporter 2-like isoform X2 [Amblyomma americanum]